MGLQLVQELSSVGWSWSGTALGPNTKTCFTVVVVLEVVVVVVVDVVEVVYKKCQFVICLQLVK